MMHKGEAAGLKVLAAIRGKPEDDSDVQREKGDILEAIAIESKESGGWLDLFRSGGIQANKRFYLAMAVQFMQQMTGINIVCPDSPSTKSVILTNETGHVLCSYIVPEVSAHVRSHFDPHGLLFAALVHYGFLCDLVYH